MMQYQINVQAGQQQQGYASGGVEQMGTPLAMVNTTRALGALQISAIEQQGQLQAQVYATDAEVAQQVGLEDILSAEGQNVEQTQQTQISQAIQNTQAEDSFWTAAGSAAVNVVGNAVAPGVGSALSSFGNYIKSLF